MNPREIIAQAWAITLKERTLRKWGFITALLQTLLNAKLLIYQVWFLISYLQGDPIGFFTIEEVLLEHLPFWLFLTIIISFVVLLIVEWLFPHLAKGAIIGLAAKSYKKEEVRGGLVLAIYNFFPLFAVHELLALSSLTTVITLGSLALRYGGAAAGPTIILLTCAWVFSNLLEFCLIFAQEGIVIRKKGVRRAMSRSFKLIISYLGHVVFLMLLLFFILLRILANGLMVVLVPSTVLGLGFLLAMLLPPVAGYTLSTLLGLAIIVAASYFFAYLEVFRQNVWTITYLEFSAQRDLDHIEEKDSGE